jgi:hypothetical protein
VANRWPDFGAVLAELAAVEANHTAGDTPEPTPDAPSEKGGDESQEGAGGEKYWREMYPGALECAHWYRDLLARFYVIEEMRYGSTWITIYVGGFVRIGIAGRKKGRALIVAHMYEGHLSEAVEHLTKEGLAVVPKEKEQHLHFTADLQRLKEKRVAHEWLAQRLAPQHLITPKT